MTVASRTAASELAINGGEPITRRPFSPWPHFSEEEIATAVAVLRSGKINYWTGDEGRQFEQEFAAAAGCRYAVALANGSVALELALYALGIGPGDEVIVPSRTYVATASAVLLRGATPVFADIDRDSQNLTAETIRPLITPRTRAVIPVHLAGWPCEMDSIVVLAREHKLHVIEDCAQAHGATWNGRPVGSFGDISAFSFCQDKIITTGGEGGMVVTNDEALWKRAWSYKDHGKDYDAVHHGEHPPGYRWLHETPGTNWRLTEVQSALGRIQLRHLSASVAARRQHAAELAAEFSKIPGLRVTTPPPPCVHTYYRYYAYVRPERLHAGWDRDRILAAINAEGVPCVVGACSEIYRENAFPEKLRPSGRWPVARVMGETTLAFLVHPTLTDEEMDITCRAVAKVMRAASAG